MCVSVCCCFRHVRSMCKDVYVSSIERGVEILHALFFFFFFLWILFLGTLEEIEKLQPEEKPRAVKNPTRSTSPRIDIALDVHAHAWCTQALLYGPVSLGKLQIHTSIYAHIYIYIYT